MSRRPPLWVRLALRVLLPAEEREFFLGDLEQSRHGSWLREVLGAAALRFGARAPTHHHPTPSKGDGMISELSSDLRFGFRMMLRSPGFTAVALITMALGIGANTAMFSIVNGVVFRPLPYPQPDRIVRFNESFIERGWPTFSISPLNYWDYRDRNGSMELFAAYQSNSVTYTGGDQPQFLNSYRVTEDYLPILGANPFLGRGITESDLDPDAEPVVVLTHGFWVRAFGEDPGVLGATMIIEGSATTVVGILPADWMPPRRSRLDVILPLQPQPYWYEARGSHFLQGLGRLAEGVSLEQAQAEFSSIANALGEAYPESNAGWGATLRPLDEVLLGSSRSSLLIFMASVGLVLLIACANMANMTLARAMSRGRELAIRTAVGAGRGRVIRQLVAESVLLAAVGGGIGVVLAYGALEAFVSAWPMLLPRMSEIGMDAPVLLFSLGISLASGVLFGLAPALTSAGTGIADALRQSGRSLAGDRSRRWMRASLVIAETGLAVVLLVGTGLLVRSFSALASEDPGFDPEGRLVVETPLPREGYSTPEAVWAFGDQALERVGAVPGVEEVALSSLVPLAGSDELWGVWLESQLPGEDEAGSALFYRVSPGYFDTMGIPLLAGRDITVDDREGEPEVVVVSEAFADLHFPDGDAVGRRIRFGRDEDDPLMEIVGVVGTVHHYALGREPTPQIYRPFRQQPTGGINFVLRGSVPPASLARPVREAIGAVDPDQPILALTPAEELVSESISTPRFRAALMGGFGLTALLLAVVGLYGVMAYSVSQRSKEIGVRMALGATRGSVLGLVVREGAPLLGVGLLMGLGGAFALSRILESMLFGVGARDPGVFVSVPVILLTVATLAMVVPARRAARVDPVKTLGEE